MSVAVGGGRVAAGMSYQIGYGHFCGEPAEENAGNPCLEQG